MEKYTSTGTAARFWLFTWLTFSVGGFVIGLFENAIDSVTIFLLCALVSCLGSMPASIIIALALSSIRDKEQSLSNKLFTLIMLQFFLASLYGLTYWNFMEMKTSQKVSYYLPACSSLAVLFPPSSTIKGSAIISTMWLFMILMSWGMTSQPFTKIKTTYKWKTIILCNQRRFTKRLPHQTK